MPGIESIQGVHILAGHIKNRLCVFSFYVENVHYNLVVSLLNDRFGIQARGGCSCAGTYGHYLLNIDQAKSKRIQSDVERGVLNEKPGWVRLSVHPTTTDAEAHYIIDSLRAVVENLEKWSSDYSFDNKSGEYKHFSSDSESEREWLENSYEL
jgi:selenocysteine lyase/cysteine desulfurase